MGEQVQAGPLKYTVLESDWRTELPGGKSPKDRFLVVRVSVANTSGSEVAVPAFSLVGPTGTSYPELTEGVEEVQDWLGMMRRLSPNETVSGVAVFDAPMGPGKLVVSDAADIADERHAHIEIPVALE